MIVSRYRNFVFLALAIIIVSVCLFGLLYNQNKSLSVKAPSNYLWSKRVFDVNEYNLLPTEFISKPSAISEQIKKAQDILWIRNTSSDLSQNTDLDYLGVLLDSIEHPVILVTSDGDRAVPSSYDSQLVEKILASDKIVKWYTQNYDKTLIHPKLQYYPIGLDMHTPSWLESKNFDHAEFFMSDEELRNRKFNYYLEMRDKYQTEKINRIFCDSHLSVTHSRRKEMHESLKNNSLIDFQNDRVHYRDAIENYAKYRFVLSPRGNGLDCHRTWEAILVGAIVITESSSLDEMFVKNDLPVIILNNFEELNNVSEETLERWYNENKHKTDRAEILKKFDPAYWIYKD